MKLVISSLEHFLRHYAITDLCHRTGHGSKKSIIELDANFPTRHTNQNILFAKFTQWRSELIYADPIRVACHLSTSIHDFFNNILRRPCSSSISLEIYAELKDTNGTQVIGVLFERRVK